MSLVRSFVLKQTQNKKGGRGRGTTKRRSQRRNNGSQSMSIARVPRDIPYLALGSGQVYGFPNKMLTRLRYVDTIPMTSTSGAIANQVMQVNSTYDPDYTSAGHQPLYRDTYAALYDYYSVIECRIKVKFVNTTSTPLHCGIVMEDDATRSSTYSTLMEQNNGKHGLVQSQTGSLSTISFDYVWTAKKQFGIDPLINTDYRFAVGGNPTNGAYLFVWSQPVDAASTGTSYVQVELDQLVLWSELQTPTGS